MNKQELEKKSKQILFLLSQRRKLSLTQICKSTNEHKNSILLSLGSLIRDEKVLIYERGDDLIVEKIFAFTNHYYY